MYKSATFYVSECLTACKCVSSVLWHSVINIFNFGCMFEEVKLLDKTEAHARHSDILYIYIYMERSSNERYKKDKERYQFSEQQKRMEEAGRWGQKLTRVWRATASEWVICIDEPVYNSISLCDTSSVVSDILWFQLISHC